MMYQAGCLWRILGIGVENEGGMIVRSLRQIIHWTNNIRIFASNDPATYLVLGEKRTASALRTYANALISRQVGDYHGISQACA